MTQCVCSVFARQSTGSLFYWSSPYCNQKELVSSLTSLCASVHAIQSGLY